MSTKTVAFNTLDNVADSVVASKGSSGLAKKDLSNIDSASIPSIQTIDENHKFIISDALDNLKVKRLELEKLESHFMVREGGITVNVSTSQELIDTINEYNRKKLKDVVTIQLADGTYTIDNTIHITGTGDETGYIYIKGNEADRTATTIHINVPNENWGLSVSHYGKLKMSDILITGNLNTSDNTGNYGIACRYHSYLDISNNMEFHNFKTAVQASGIGYIQADNSTYRECGYSIRSCGGSVVSAYSIDISVTENNSFSTFGIQVCNTSSVYVSGSISNVFYGLHTIANSYSYARDLSVYNTRLYGILVDNKSIAQIGGSSYSTVIDGNSRCSKGAYVTNNSTLVCSSGAIQVSNCSSNFYCTTGKMIIPHAKSINASDISYRCEDTGKITATHAYSQLPADTGKHFSLGVNTYIFADNSELYGGSKIAECHQSSTLRIDNTTSADAKSVELHRMSNVSACGTDFTANISANTVTTNGIFYK